MKKKNIESIYKLSPLQRGLLFETLAGNDGGHVLQWDVTAQAEISADALRQTWARLLERHTILRTEFYWEGLSEFFQVVKKTESLEVPLDLHDWSAKGDAVEDAFAELMGRRRREGFDPRRAPLIQLDLVRLAGGRSRFLATVHHLVIDGWSVGMLGEELIEILIALRDGAQPRLRAAHPYRDYVDWLQKQDEAAAQRFWREELDEVRPATLPFDFADGDRGPRTEEVLSHRLADDLTAQIEELARKVGVSANAVYQSAWALLLARYCNTSEITYGVMTSGRLASLDNIESRVGPFANALPMRVRIPQSRPLDQWLREFQDKQLEIQQFEYCSLMDIVRWAGLSARGNMMEAVFSFLNVPTSQQYKAGEGGLGLDVKLRRQGANPLTLMVEFVGDTTLQLHYESNRFERSTAEAVLEHYVNLLTSFVRHPTRAPSQHSMLSAQERSTLLEQARGPAVDIAMTPVHRLFEEQARTRPERPALTFADGSWTYGELDARANAVAVALRERGVGLEDRVGVSLERSPELLAALLGVLKAGAAYVALQPELPADRLRYMAADAGLAALVCDRASANAVWWEGPRVVVEDLSTDGPAPAAVEVDGEHLAYILYTSGTTGYPKGVEMRHAAVSNLVDALHRRGLFDEDSVVLWKTPVGFDVSVSEMFNTLAAGGRLVVAEPGAERDPRKLIAAIRAEQVNTLRLVPTALHMLTEPADFASCRSVRTVICAGEALTGEIAGRFFERSDGELFNLLGATETCVDTTFWRCERDAHGPIVPVGGALENYRVYVLDGALEPVPTRLPGEFYAAGAGLGRGYRGMPGRTAQSFVPDPHAEAPGSRMYRTGDVVRWGARGALEYLGRADDQLQVRGIRVELAAVEAHLASAPGVEQAAVRAVGEVSGRAESLVGYVVAQPAGVDAAQLRAHLLKHLPEAVVPSNFVVVDEMPRSASGKINRAALPDPKDQLRGRERVLPDNETQRQIAAIWAKHLDLDEVGIHENFFEIGGHSLMAVRVQSDLEKAFGFPFPLGELIARPTISGLEEFVIQTEAAQIPEDDLEALLAELENE